MKPSSVKTLVPCLAAYTRIVTLVTFADPDGTKVPAALSDKEIRPCEFPKGKPQQTKQTVLVQSLENCHLGGEDVAREAAKEYYGFADATVVAQWYNDRISGKEFPQIRISMRRPDPRNPVKANYRLDEPEFATILHHLQGLVGTLTVKTFPDPYAQVKGEMVLLIELRKARVADPHERIQRICALNAEGFQILEFPKEATVVSTVETCVEDFLS